MPELTMTQVAEMMRLLQATLAHLDELGLNEIARHVSLSLDQFKDVYSPPR